VTRDASCRSGESISQFTVVSPVIVGGLRSQLATHHVQPETNPCSDEVLGDDSSSWQSVRTVYIGAKTDFKFDGNQTRKFDVVLRKIVGTNVLRRTVCSYNVRVIFVSTRILAVLSGVGLLKISQRETPVF